MSVYEEFVAKCKAVVRRLGGDASTITEIEWEMDSSDTVLFRTVVLSPRPPGKRPLKSPRKAKRQDEGSTPDE